MEYGTFGQFANEIRRITSLAEERKVTLRIMGGAAIRIHCPNHSGLYERLRRTPKHDMDFVTYPKNRPDTKKLFLDLGYKPYISLMLTGATGRHRQIFNDENGNRAIDVFLGKLEMCHVIDFKGRLEADTPTVPLTELLLQKLQIVQTDEKDIQDAIILLREHDVSDTDDETINGTYLARLLACDWGFYYTVHLNCEKLKEFVGKYGALTDKDQKIITERIDKLLKQIEDEPKTLQWKLRSKLGASIKWYNVVEEVQRN